MVKSHCDLEEYNSSKNRVKCKSGAKIHCNPLQYNLIKNRAEWINQWQARQKKTLQSVARESEEIVSRIWNK